MIWTKSKEFSKEILYHSKLKLYKKKKNSFDMLGINKILSKLG